MFAISDTVGILIFLSLAGILSGIAIFAVGRIRRAEETMGKTLKQMNRYRLLLQTTPHILFVIDREGVLLDIQGEKNYGLNLPRPKLLGKKISQMLSKKVSRQIMYHVKNALGTRVPQTFDGQLLLNGKRHHYRTRLLAVNEREVIAVVIETTAQKEAEGKFKILNEAMEQRVSQLARSEKALEKQSRMLHSVIESIGDGMIVIDINGTFLLVNPAAEKIIGVELMGANLNEWAHQWEWYLSDGETSCPREELPLTRAIQGLEVDDVEIFIKNQLRPNGLWLNINARPLKDAAGSLKGGVVLFRDITERKQAQEALLKSEAKNRALLNAIPDLMLLIKNDGTFLGFVAAKDDDSGISARDVVGQKVEQVFPQEVASQIMHYAAQAIHSHTPQIFEYQMEKNGEMRDYESRLVACVGDEALAIVRDITERKKVERMKNEFISTVSHELRTPLTSIQGSLGLIVGGIGGHISEQVKNLVNIALNNTKRLVRLINDILDIQRVESGNMIFHLQWLKLTPLIEQAIESNHSYADQFGVKFVFKTSLPHVEVHVDSDRLIQVMTNLLSNAAKFSPERETVDISIFNYDKAIRVSVTDRGPGIAKEFRSRIFQRFAQADSSDTRQRGGTGLGLSIAKSIIEKLGGQIGFETEVNVGSTFYFDLPHWREPSGLEGAKI